MLHTTPASRCAALKSLWLWWAIALSFGCYAFADGLIASPEADWPQWRGARRDGVSTETGLLPTWPVDGPELIWKVEGLGVGWSSPIIVGQRLFITGDIGEDLMVFAFDLNGNPVWRSKNGSSWTGSFPGARACCCYAGGRVYHLNAHGRLACFDATTGREIWGVDIRERFDARNITWALSECLLVDGSRVIVTPGGRRALMAALDRDNGATVWTTQALDTDRTSYCSPILFEQGGRRVIANCSSAHGFGVDADTGELLWTVPLKNQYGANVATPIYGSEAIYFVTPYTEEGRCYRLRTDESRMAAEQIWQSPLDTVTGAGVLVQGTLFTAGYRKNKWWMAVDWRTGQITSQLKDLTTGAAIYADGRLYCQDERGNVGLLIPTPNDLQLAGKFSLVHERVSDAWAHPVLLGGRLYLRYHDALYCYQVRET